MTDIEIPLGKRTKQYRFFEILPGAISVGAVVLLIVFSLISPLIASVYVMTLVLLMFVRAVGIAFRTIQGRIILNKSAKLPWRKWLNEFEKPGYYAKRRHADVKSRAYGLRQHVLNLEQLADLPEEYPKPSAIYHAVIIAMYNESYDILRPTLQSLLKCDYDSRHLIVTIAYEQRGGQVARDTVAQIKRDFTGKFNDLLFFEHPDGLPDEVVGKGGNITFAGKQVAKYVLKRRLDPKNVIVTTLDSDNRPDKNYFAYLTYEWIVNPRRQRTSFQPICSFTNNIWDAPAPMRVIATSNTFWNVISSMRPHTLRNFASHAQGLEPLMSMDFWSTRTIVEDGHQYWRSYFFFDGDYDVVPLRTRVGQDAVLSDTFRKTLWAQFKQLRRWAYGASDVAYVAKNIWRRDRTVPFWAAFTRFCRLLEGHVTLACMAIIVAVGAWVPLFLNPNAASHSLVAHELPLTIGRIQQIAIIGLFITVLTSLSMLPPRPKRYNRAKGVMMVVQWILMPINAIVYSSVSSYTAQIRLMTGHYMDKFDVTDKVVKK
jgi:cellulose synthase/poly-beta-1,6-N-acetylglucosamine synthase-like glycosyltransferase